MSKTWTSLTSLTSLTCHVSSHLVVHKYIIVVFFIDRNLMWMDSLVPEAIASHAPFEKRLVITATSRIDVSATTDALLTWPYHAHEVHITTKTLHLEFRARLGGLVSTSWFVGVVIVIDRKLDTRVSMTTPLPSIVTGFENLDNAS